MKKVLIIVFLFISIISTLPTEAVEFESCTKTFYMDCETLFFKTLSSLSANNYKIVEIQSCNGFILFSAYGRTFFAVIAKNNNNSSTLRITPADSNYNFSPTILQQIFKDLL